MTKYVRKSKITKSKRKPKTTKKRGILTTSRPSGPFKTYNTADPFRSSMSVKFHYAENHIQTSGIGGYLGTEQIYRLNALHDPNFSAIGHQPYGYDQVQNLYRKYKVNAVMVELKWSDPSEDGMVIGIQFQPPNAAYTLTGAHIQDVREQPMSVTRSINNSGSQTGVIKQFFPISALSGLTPLQFKADVDLFTSTVLNLPTAVPLLRFAVGSDRGTNGASLIVKIRVVYYSTMYERKVQLQS